MYICLHLDDVIVPWESTKRAGFVAQNIIGLKAIIWIFRGFHELCSVSGFKITAKLPEIKIRKIPAISCGNPEIFENVWHNFGTKNARKSIKRSEDSYSSLGSNKTLSHEIDLLDRRWRHQKHRTYLSHDVIDQKPQIQNKNFFILNYKTSRVFRGFEQLSSSICCRVTAGENLPW